MHARVPYQQRRVEPTHTRVPVVLCCYSATAVFCHVSEIFIG